MSAADPTADAFDCVDSERDAGRSIKMMPLPFTTPDVPKVMVAVTIRSRPIFRYEPVADDPVPSVGLVVDPFRTGVNDVHAVKNGASSTELSRTFAFQNAAVSTSPEGVEGERLGRGVGYDSAYE